jgi:hypothetical protein
MVSRSEELKLSSGDVTVPLTHVSLSIAVVARKLNALSSVVTTIAELSTGAVVVTLERDSLFEFHGCNGLMKDVLLP